MLAVEYVPIDLLAAWPGNPKTHDLPTLVASMRRFGFTQPLLVDEASGRIVAGHGRVEALAQLKASGEDPPSRVRVDENDAWCVPVVALMFDDVNEASAYVVADNRVVELGGWDTEELVAMLAQIDLDGVGYDENDRKRLEKISVSEHERALPQIEGLSFSVIVDCDDEQAQKQILIEMESRGFACRLLMS